MGLNSKWTRLKLVKWNKGDDVRQGDVIPSAYYSIPEDAPSNKVATWARQFGAPPTDSAGAACPARPGDRLLRTEADLATLVQERAGADMRWQHGGDVDWALFADRIRPGYYPVHVSNVISVVQLMSRKLARAVVQLTSEHEAASAPVVSCWVLRACVPPCLHLHCI